MCIKKINVIMTASSRIWTRYFSDPETGAQKITTVHMKTVIFLSGTVVKHDA